MSNSVHLVECPRDAIQGLKTFISTEKKINYLNYLLSLNRFETLDFGSFVSPRAIPQMADTLNVLKKLKFENSKTMLLAIVANERGAEEASLLDEISYLGFPFSISETFQLRNTNTSITTSLDNLRKMQNICLKSNKRFVVYLSMAFGNPYGDLWSIELVESWFAKMVEEGIQTISISDTIGSATLETIENLCSNLIPKFPKVSVGLHLHTKYEDASKKIKIAYQNGCNRFDGAILGYGGCPMAKDELVGNMPSEFLLSFFERATEEEISEQKNKFLELIS